MNEDQNKEIELKVFIGENKAGLAEKFKALGWQKVEEEAQEDIYYTSKYKDFISTEECLRIRITKDLEELTWKPPTSNEMLKKKQFWKQEVDINITGQSSKLRLMLKELDFIEYVAVKKHRTIFRVDEYTIIALDKVQPLGWFVEIETSLNSSEKGTQRNEELLHMLDLNHASQINIPYRDLVKAGKVYYR